MKAILDRLLWVPVSKVHVDRIKEDMTIDYTPFRGPRKTYVLYEIKEIDGEVYIGVPRRWGLKALREYNLEIEDRTSFPAKPWPKLTFPKEWAYRPGQEDAVNTVIASFANYETGGLLEAPCGAGKTLMALDIASRLNTPALILVHKGDLATQWHKTANGCLRENKPCLFPGIVAGHVQQNELVYKGCHFVTAMAQTLLSRKDSLPEDFWNYFGTLILDEGHRYPAESFEYVLRQFPARHRLGVSATWRRTDNLECIWSWHVGTVVAKPKVVRLSGEYIQVLWNTNLTDKMFKAGSFMNSAAYITSISSNTAYNNWLIEQLIESTKKGRKALLVSDRVQQCETLKTLFYQKMIEQGLVADVGLYLGGGKFTKDELLNASKKQVILATYQMIAEGTDIPSIDTLFLATPKSDVEQVVGRIQRPCADKKRLLVVDVVFNTPWNKKIAKKRLNTYEKLGFIPQEPLNE